MALTKNMLQATLAPDAAAACVCYRCSSYYFLPKGCTYETDPKDACCKVARCHPADFPTPTPMATSIPTTAPVSTPKIVSVREFLSSCKHLMFRCLQVTT